MHSKNIINLPTNEITHTDNQIKEYQEIQQFIIGPVEKKYLDIHWSNRSIEYCA